MHWPLGPWNTFANPPGATDAGIPAAGRGTLGSVWFDRTDYYTTNTAVVTVQDQFRNTVGTDTSTVTLAIGTNPGGGTLGALLELRDGDARKQ